jgi:ssDNA-binding Zn-finger/Zn-ribbon topoisomerase 1
MSYWKRQRELDEARARAVRGQVRISEDVLDDLQAFHGMSKDDALDEVRKMLGLEQSDFERLAGLKVKKMMFPACPRCGTEMVLRKNSTTGDPFFGCERFPSCRGTLPLDEGVRNAIDAGRLKAEMTTDPAPGGVAQVLKDIHKDLSTKIDTLSARLDQVQEEISDSEASLREELAARVGALSKERKKMEKQAEKVALKEDSSGSVDGRKQAVPAMEQLKSFGTAIGTGVAMGGVDKVGDLFVKMAMKMSKNSPAVTAALADPLGREIVKFLTATTVRTTCLSAPNLVPGSEGIAKAADLQIMYSSAKLTSEGLSLVGEELAALAQIGKELAALPPPSQAASIFTGEPMKAAAR